MAARPDPAPGALARGARRAAVASPLLGLLILGLGIAPDYGAHWDEMNNQRFGRRWADYVMGVAWHGRTATRPAVRPRGHDQVHGPAFEVPLHMATRALGLSDPRDVMLARHRITFGAFVLGVCAFFALAARVLGSQAAALLACALFVVHPRIFSHAFYNSVDIPFMAAFTVATLTLLRFLDAPTPGRAAAHALASAVLVDIRVAGASLVLCTGVLIAAAWWRATAHEGGARGRLARGAAVYLALLPVFVVLFWPMLWVDPARTFVDAARAATQARQGTSPWYYNVAWIARTTPLLHVAFFVVGLAATAVQLARPPAGDPAARRDRIAVLLMFFAPLAITAVVQPRLTDDWRHHYFLYPGLVLIATMGLAWSWTALGARRRGGARAAAAAVLGAVVAIGLGEPVVFMLRHHPHQNVYAGTLAPLLGGVRVDGALDYWGLAYRRALEHVLERDGGDPVPIAVRNAPGHHSHQMLAPAQRRRLALVPTDEAWYYVTNFRFQPPLWPPWEPVWALAVDGEAYVAVYRRRE